MELLWNYQELLWNYYGITMELLWNYYGIHMALLWNSMESSGIHMERTWIAERNVEKKTKISRLFFCVPAPLLWPW